jgi:hypothetical protein
MANFIFILFKAVSIQLVGVFGIFFVFGYILSKLQTATQRRYLRSFGWWSILWTAWIGTPIHELSHLLMAKVFRHTIDSFALLKPNPKTGGLGYVNHTYNPNSLFQKVGNFFIGSSPMISGSVILFLLLTYLVPDATIIIDQLTQLDTVREIPLTMLAFFQTLFTIDHLQSPLFWLFLYLSFAVCSHMAPSKQDRKGLWEGLGYLSIIIIGINMFAIAIQFDITRYILESATYLSMFSTLFLYAIMVSVVHHILARILTAPWYKK